MTDELKTGGEILDEYFKKLKDEASISDNLKTVLINLWKEKKLSTKTSLTRALDELRKQAK